jgi:sugar lactone lactonase YvrE
VCDDVHALCVAPEQVTACLGAAQNAPCSYAGAPDGACTDAVCFAAHWLSTAVVGSALESAVGLESPEGVAVDERGNVYVADTYNHRIRRVDAVTLDITTIAGRGTPCAVSTDPCGDGGAATSAELNHPYGLALDGLANVYIADSNDHRIRRVDAGTGIITTVAGDGNTAFSGDGGAATSAHLWFPFDVAIDGLGTLYIADTNHGRIRRVDAGTGIITTVAGTGPPGFSGDGGPATSAALNVPNGVALDGLGNLYIADTSNHRIRRVAAGTGVITTVAGTGSAPSTGSTSIGDGGAATSAQLNYPGGVVIDGLGNVYIADSRDHRIRRVDAGTGIITTVAGTEAYGANGDGGPATRAQLYYPHGVTLDRLGNVSIADTYNNRIRRVVAITGIITTVAGTGTFGLSGDGGAAISAQLTQPEGAVIDGLGNVYIADTFNHRIRRVDAGAGTITTVAGNGTPAFSGDGGAATSAQLIEPYSVAVAGSGNVYIADTYNSRIRRVNAATGIITTIAGNGTFGFSGDGGAATSAGLYEPHGVALDGLGNVYIADYANNRVRRVDAVTGIITTVAGTGSIGALGDGGAATSAELDFPQGVALDGLGNVYIADTGNHRIRRVAAGTGIITTVAGKGTPGFSGDGGAATSAQLYNPQGVTLDGPGNVYIADSVNGRVRRVNAGTGIITTVAGTGFYGSSGDGGVATSAELFSPQGVATDGLGNVYITDSGTDRIRRLDAGTGKIFAVAGAIDPEGMGPLAQAHLADPRALVVTTPFTLVAGGASGTVQAMRAGQLAVVAGRYLQAVSTANLARFRDQSFGAVGGIAYDATAGLIYLTESTANRLHVVTVVDPNDPNTWTIAPLAGAADAAAGFADGSISTAQFRSPSGLLLDATTHTLYIADTGNDAIRKLDLETNEVTTVTTVLPAGEPPLSQPSAITRCPNGDLFIADTGNNRVRRVGALGALGAMTTVLGDGVAASSGQGSPARSFSVDAPRGLACDDFGNLYVASSTAVRLLAAATDGAVDGSGVVHTIYGAPPRDTFPASNTSCLTGLAVTGPTTIQIADSCSGLLVQLDRVLDAP